MPVVNVMNNRTRKSGIKVAVATLGCKVNQFESASFQNSFEAKGYTLVPFSNAADVYVINTCAVTGKAGAQSRQMIRRALNTNPSARLVVTGCYAQVAPEEIKELSDAPIRIVGNSKKHLLVDSIVSKTDQETELIQSDIRKEKEISQLPVEQFLGRTRAFLKIQDGCNNFCSYCIVPYARGRSRSQATEEVCRQAEAFASQGYKEAVVTGIHVGDYGRDLAPSTDLLSLLKKLVERTPDMRYRISSLEPTEINDPLLQFVTSAKNLMPHFHIPLQSGDDTVLKKMNRRYSSEDFAVKVEKIIKNASETAIGIDVLVGFPGEDEKAFMNTYRLLDELPVSYLHVFPYSSRPGTIAAEMPDQVSRKNKEERVARLRELDNKKRADFFKSQLGTVHNVLVEGVKGNMGFVQGFTENYIPVLFKSQGQINNHVVAVKLERISDRKVFGMQYEAGKKRNT